MKLSDITMRYAIRAFGIDVRWLKEALHARGVSVRLTDTCLREFVLDADRAARLATPARNAATQGSVATEPYALRLRREIAARADFLRAWTRTDARIDVADPALQPLADIARKHALPRAWTLSEPLPVKARHPTPTYLNWASAG